MSRELPNFVFRVWSTIDAQNVVFTKSQDETLFFLANTRRHFDRIDYQSDIECHWRPVNEDDLRDYPVTAIYADDLRRDSSRLIVTGVVILLVSVALIAGGFFSHF